jgi:hypothetical protein
MMRGGQTLTMVEGGMRVDEDLRETGTIGIGNETGSFYMCDDLSFIGRESPRPRFRAVVPGRAQQARVSQPCVIRNSALRPLVLLGEAVFLITFLAFPRSSKLGVHDVLWPISNESPDAPTCAPVLLIASASPRCSFGLPLSVLTSGPQITATVLINILPQHILVGSL